MPRPNDSINQIAGHKKGPAAADPLWSIYRRRYGQQGAAPPMKTKLII